MEKPALFSAPFILTSSLVFVHDDQDFFARLGHIKSFLISPSLPDSLSSLAASAANSAFLVFPTWLFLLLSLPIFWALIRLFFVHFYGGKNKRQKNNPEDCLQPAGINYFLKFSFFLEIPS